MVGYIKSVEHSSSFFVNSPYWIIFIKSIDAFDYAKFEERMFQLLDGLVDEIGEQNVVYVVNQLWIS